MLSSADDNAFMREKAVATPDDGTFTEKKALCNPTTALL